MWKRYMRSLLNGIAPSCSRFLAETPFQPRTPAVAPGCAKRRSRTAAARTRFDQMQARGSSECRRTRRANRQGSQCCRRRAARSHDRDAHGSQRRSAPCARPRRRAAPPPAGSDAAAGVTVRRLPHILFTSRNLCSTNQVSIRPNEHPIVDEAPVQNVRQHAEGIV